MRPARRPKAPASDLEAAVPQAMPRDRDASGETHGHRYDRSVAGQDLATWVQTDQPWERRRIQQIQLLAHELVATFAASFLHESSNWPYELVQSKGRDAPEQPSFSTTAMIAFALSLVRGRIHTSSLAPSAAMAGGFGVGGSQAASQEDLSNGSPNSVEALVDAALMQLILDSNSLNADALAKQHGLKKAHPSPLTNSGTFGVDDPFTLTWLLEVLRGRPGNEGFLKALRRRAEQRVRVVLNSDSPGTEVLQIRSDEVVDHAFPVLRILQLRESLQQDPGGRPAIGSVARVREYFLSRVHTQLSLSQIPNSGFDTGDLVFSLEGWILTSPYEPDLSIVDRVFAVLREAQAQNLYWRPLRPFKATPQGLVLLPQSVEIANSLLRICSTPSLQGARYFSRNKDLLDGYGSWLLGRIRRGSFRKGRGGKRQPNEFVGWESENSPRSDRIHLWQTSQALIFLQQYTSLLHRHVADEGLQRAHLSRQRPKGRDEAREEWASLAASDALASLPEESEYRVVQRIDRRFAVGASENGPRSMSLLLYGPPGTGKTTIARRLAGALGFPMITVTPSDFAAEGGEAVEARAKAIFDVLEEQRNTLVFFDEIDQLLLDRESDFYERQGDLFKLLTPGMLTKLARLAEQRLVTVVVATNYIERIDRAIRRPGRIDERLPVLPPDREQRARFLSREVGGWDSVVDADANDIVDRTLWYTYRELLGVATDVGGREAKVREGELAEEVLKSLERRPALIDYRQYRGRLKGLEPGEQPLEEFALLMLLYLELHATLPSDSWVSDALKNALDAVRDADVRDRLQKSVAGSGVANE
jgi:hypothetical protein